MRVGCFHVMRSYESHPECGGVRVGEVCEAKGESAAQLSRLATSFLRGDGVCRFEQAGQEGQAFAESDAGLRGSRGRPAKHLVSVAHPATPRGRARTR
ncbi:hypothetical protein GCM10020220_059750 [Nonomuraea rubra]